MAMGLPLKVGVVATILVVSLIFLQSLSPLPSISPATGGVLFTPAVMREGDFSTSPGDSFVVTPADGSEVDLESISFIEIYQYSDNSPVQSAVLQLDNFPPVTISASDIQVEIPEIKLQSKPLGRFIRIMTAFNDKPDSVHYVSSGAHTLKVKIKTSLPNPSTSKTNFTVNSPGSVIFEGRNFTPAYFAGPSSTVLDCAQNPACTRTIKVIQLGTASDSFAQWAARKQAATDLVKGAQDLILSQACINLVLQYHVIIFPTGTDVPGFDESTNFVSNAEDVFLYLFENNPGVVQDDGTTKPFKDELKGAGKAGETPVILSESYLQPYTKSDGTLMSRVGVTFQTCTTVVDGKKCVKGYTNPQIMMGNSDSTILAHEMGHDFYTMGNSKMSEDEQHDEDPNPDGTTQGVPNSPNNFMHSPGPTGPADITPAQAAYMYKVCVKKSPAAGGGGPGSPQVSTTSNGVLVPANGGLVTVEPNFESCAGSTRAPGIPNGNFGNSSNDVCSSEDNCGSAFPNTVCNFSTCVCMPLASIGPGPGIGGSPGGGSGGSGSGTIRI